MSEEFEPVPLPITGELDLHTFQPKEVTRLLEDYFRSVVSVEFLMFEWSMEKAPAR
ncbi:MAG TPA: hypothetical protein VKC60_01905 [Opitutaceae bacterium]|nr:hypothetical protein [Opitutaceae bacterium]